MAAQVHLREGTAADVELMTWATSEGLRAAWRAQARRGEAGEVCFLVAVNDDRQVMGKVVIDWTRNADGSAWLCMLSVHPDVRSLGIGRRLLAEAEHRARTHGCPAVELAVDDTNRRARDLYVHEGYVVAGPYVDEYEYSEPGGATVHVAAPGVLFRKAL